MSFQPQIPLAGVGGWRFFKRTEATQRAAFEKSPELQRDIAYFEKNIANVATAEDLVNNRRLLKVALGAFGLDSEIDKKAYVRKILEGGTDSATSMANRLTAAGVKEFAQAFGFGNASGAQTAKAGFAATIVAAYKVRQFESAVGISNNDVRIAMNFTREMAKMSQGTEGASWFVVLASKPLRTVFEKAFNLPSDFAKIDLDQQRNVMRSKTRAMFGTDNLTAFADSKNVEKILSRYFARMQIDGSTGASSPASNALSLLQGSGAGSSAGLYNLLLSGS